MPTQFDRQAVQLSGAVRLEEAEALREWLQQNPSAEIDLHACSQIHTGVLQVLLAHRGAISAWPQDPFFAAWLSHYQRFLTSA